ncbi:MAG TPA: hypothetical protein PLG55_09370 [Methanospirillum sp.]|nr:hypothetical protein [Methanospirillum sp.]
MYILQGSYIPGREVLQALWRNQRTAGSKPGGGSCSGLSLVRERPETG